MRYSKKTAGVAASVATLMMLAGGASAMAYRGPGEEEDKVEICHREGNGSYHIIEVDNHAVPAHFEQHPNDVYPDSQGRCPGDDLPPGGEEPPAQQAGSCSADQSNSSNNSTGNTTQSGLINVGGIALQGTNLGLLNNLLCMGNVGNGLLGNVLGLVLGGGGSSGSSGSSDSDGGPECSADQDNSSTNSMGGGLIAGLININGIGIQGNNIGALNNLLCGGNVLNDLTAVVLGTAGLF